MTTSATNANLQRYRSPSRDGSRSSRPRSPSPPSQTYHPSILPRSVPTPALVESVAGGAHYSGIRVDPESLKHRHSSHSRHPSSHVEVKADHHRLMADLKELYCLRPSVELLERGWRKDAIFEDPFSFCKGFDEYAAQWFALPRLFSKSETISSRVMSSTHIPNRLVYSQTQEYTYRFFGHKKTVQSIIIVDMDEHEKIIRVTDQWNGKDLPTHFGAHFLRRANAKLTPWIVRVPKSAH